MFGEILITDMWKIFRGKRVPYIQRDEMNAVGIEIFHTFYTGKCEIIFRNNLHYSVDSILFR